MKYALANVALVIFGPAIIIICIEVTSFGIIHASTALTGKPDPYLAGNLRFKFHPIWTNNFLIFSDPLGTNECSLYHPYFGTSNKIDTYCRHGGLVDRHGFLRNSIEDREIDNNNYLIFMVGGSTVQGIGASSIEKNFTSLLESELRENKHAVQVVNAGKKGRYSPEELNMIIHRIHLFNPDLVISMSGTNDYRYIDEGTQSVEGQEDGYYYMGDPAVTIYEHINFQSKTVIHAAKSVLFNARDFLFRYTYTGYLFYVLERKIGIGNSARKDHSLRIKSQALSKDWLDESVDPDFESEIQTRMAAYIRYIQMTRAVLKELNIEHLHVIQPMSLWDRHQMSPRDQVLKDRLSASKFIDRKVNPEKRAQYILASLQRELKSRNINHMDFSGIFPNDVDVYTDGIHYNDLGNRIIAEALVETIDSHYLNDANASTH